LRSTQEESDEKAADNGRGLGSDGLDAAAVQDGLALLPSPEGVKLPDHRVVEPGGKVTKLFCCFHRQSDTVS